MLVLSRKKHEALLIDGTIRIEVVSLARATVRLRLTAPRNLQPTRGPVRREARAESTRAEGPPGLEVAEITLLNQQLLPLGDSISLGVLDADKSRVLMFVEAPTGMSVSALELEPRDPGLGSTRQNLLQFMRPGPDRPEPPTIAAVDRPSPTEGPSRPQEEPPRFLPFPSAATRTRGSGATEGRRTRGRGDRP